MSSVGVYMIMLHCVCVCVFREKGWWGGGDAEWCNEVLSGRRREMLV